MKFKAVSSTGAAFFCNLAPYLVFMSGNNLAPRFKTALLLLILLSLGITLKNIYAPLSRVPDIPFPVTLFNNFLIFKNSFYHLLLSLPLFETYGPVQYDVFKYTPTFALLFAPFAVGNDVLGLFLWNALNVILPFLALTQLTKVHKKRWLWLFVFFAVESSTSMLNSQSNGLMLGLMLWTLVFYQREKWHSAVFCILLTGFIKIFGLVLFSLFLFQKRHWFKIALSTIIQFTVLFSLPLIFVSWDYLISQYLRWFILLKSDGGYFVKYSVLGWIQSWFHYLPNKSLTLLVALLIQLILAAIIRNRKELMVYYGLTWGVWVVIFNHMAESATFIIAVGSMVAFYLLIDKLTRVDLFLLVLVLIFTVFGPTDLYPREVRFWIVETAQMKVFPVILVYLRMIQYLVRNSRVYNSIDVS